MRYLGLGFLLACDPSTTVTDKVAATDTAPEDTGEAPFESAFAGGWSGTVSGFAQFNADWETAPYCSGELTATVAATGDITASGTCVILFGPYTDLAFDVSAAGVVTSAGEAGLDVLISEPTDAHVWDDGALSGTGDAAAGTMELQGDAQYYPTGMDPIAGFEVVSLTAD